MAIRCRYQSSNDVGVYAKLTNSYCLIGQGASENFYSYFEEELQSHIPIVHCSVSYTSLIGRLLCGNKRGLLVPDIISDNEL